MAGKRKIERKIDKVRAGNDGHEFHHVWTARMSLQLLRPDTELIAIAVEGLSPSDQAKVPAATVEVADLTLYYGKQPGFENASKTVFAQFKYSIANRDKGFRASDAKETLKKFGKTYRSFKTKYGAKTVEDKLEFHLITNQPVYEPLIQAIEALQAGEDPTCSAKVPVKTQAQQIKAASGLSGRSLAAFARKLKIVGRSDGGGDGGGAGRSAGQNASHNAGLSQNLPDAKNALASLLVDWSATNDSLARARIGQLQALVREKAGYTGNSRNLIKRMDVLAALQIGDLKDLLPCPCALADVGPVLEQQQLDEAVIRMGEVREPLLIHATAGVGKTVFMSSLAGRVSDHFEVVFFDCFGGGAYRSPEDGRHLPKRGLIHIANTLAFKGLCDPILPGSDDVQTLLRTFRRRLEQCMQTLSCRVTGQAHAGSPQLVIFIDAIDNAVFATDPSREDCFPVKLIEALHTEPIDGVKLVVSCRTERKPETYAQFDEFELHPFTKDETHAFLHARIKNVTADEVRVGFARSGGNPRVLSYLVEAGRGLFDPSQTTTAVSVEDLIRKQIEDALASAQIHGYKRRDLEAFLAGLTVLPPPVPLEEYAAAHNIEVARVESFAADLSPLLERTRHGLIIRDEPTETFIHNLYATSQSRKTLKHLASNLLASQDVSVYAARALPGLLQKLDDGKQLFELAFDDRMPASVTSRVGKSNIRYARLMAATRHAACKADWDKLVRLLVELSVIAQVDQRGNDYIVEYPDLVVAARDGDAHRRLFEIRTAWPGKRHACLSVVNVLSGDLDEATRHVKLNRDWIAHYLRQERKKFDQAPAPDQSDIAAYSFFLISADRMQDAARCLLAWRDWFAFEVTEVVLEYGRLAGLPGTQQTQPPQLTQLTSRIDQFVDALAGIGSISAALSFHEAGQMHRKALCVKLASLCKKRTKIDTTIDFPQRRSHDNVFTLEDGLRKSAVIAVSLGLGVQARAISLRARHERPKVWAFRDGFGAFGHTDVFGYIFRVALLAAVDKRPIHEKDLLPQELVPICSNIPKACVGKVFREKVLAKLDKLRGQAALQPALQLHVADDLRRSAARFLNSRLEPLLTLVHALAAALAASAKTIDKQFVQLVQAWEETRQSRDHYQARGVVSIDPFFRSLGFDAVLLVLWSRHELKRSSVDRMLAAVHGHISNPVDLVRIVSVLAQRPALHSVAAQLAIKVDKVLQSEDDATYRASLYGVLGRVILPASRNDAAFYFQKGLEQMDAIGSADFRFTNELLLFASSIKGDEVDERVSHVLSNICELTMSDEPEKFNWGAYGRGMANVAGIRGLAKLSRWDDRNTIALGNTLQNYLTGLVAAQKISPRDAVYLNCLASPVEYFDAGTKEFAHVLQARKTLGTLDALDAETVAELVTQFVDNNPGFASKDTLATLYDISVRVLTSEHDLTRYLESGLDNYGTVKEGLNKEGLNIRTGSVGGTGGTGGTKWLDPTTNTTAAKRVHDNRTALERIAAETDPTDMSSLVKAIDGFNALGNLYDLKGEFFASLREKVPFAACSQYFHNVADLEHLSFYWKLTELKEAKQAWKGTSAALSGTDHGLALQLIRAYAKYLVGDGLFSGSGFGSIIHEVSELTGVSKPELVRELINACSSSDAVIPGSVWLAFASLICSEAEEGQGQEALKRLLTSEVGSEVATEVARIASHVTDGPWEAGLYPDDDFVDVASGLIWRMLGSPSAVDRWRAAHCIRRFAKFERWDIVDKLVGSFDLEGAGPFQAPELKFYYLHARLWLLIALARAALDHPVQVSSYKTLFLAVVMNEDAPHVLMQHFAAKALVACVDLGKLTLEPDVLDIVRNVDKSPFERAPTKGVAGFYLDDVRPKSVAKPAHRFLLEYDFRKYDVDGLGRVVSKRCWEVEDTISAIAQQIDPTVNHMSDDGGREQRGQSSFEMTRRWHGYGQQLGYHGLFFAAGKLLATHPVTEGLWGEDDPWAEWLDRYLLTHKDGFWLSDGTDRIPADVPIKLLEPEGEGYALTGDQKIIMALAGLDAEKGVGRELIVHGNWHSTDGVEVRLSSALVTPQKSRQLASKLIEENPMSVWLPVFQADGEPEYSRREPDGYTPWIVCPTGETRLDEHDPYGVSEANLRPRLATQYRELCKLTPQDAFGRHWQNNRGTRSLTAQAWGRSNTNREYGPRPGVRLSCKSGLLKKVLASDGKELLILFKLQRYEKETYASSGKYWHSIAVVCIDKSLKVEYFGGRVNHEYR